MGRPPGYRTRIYRICSTQSPHRGYLADTDTTDAGSQGNKVMRTQEHVRQEGWGVAATRVLFPACNTVVLRVVNMSVTDEP